MGLKRLHEDDNPKSCRRPSWTKSGKCEPLPMPWKTPGASPDFSPNNREKAVASWHNSFVRKKSCQEERQPYNYTVYPETLPISSPNDERFARSLTAVRLPARVVGYCCQR